MTRRAVILAEGSLGTLTGKTANVLVMYNKMRFKVVGVIDSTNSGLDAGEVLGIGKMGIPVVSSLEEALKLKPEVLIIGVATVGGILPNHYRGIVKKAIELGLEIWSGLHHFLSDDPEFSKLVKKYNTKIVDVRKYPKDKLRIWDGRIFRTNCGRVLVAGTDCVVGKNITTLELYKEFKKRGYNTGIVATGQTMIMVGAHAGATIDSIPSDFCSGVVEQLVTKLDKEGYNPIIVEGQASILHPAYGQVSLSILYGCMPEAVVLAHDPWRKIRDDMKIPMEPIEREIKAIEFLASTSKVVAISIMGYNRSPKEISEACYHLERKIGLPVADPRRDPGKLADAVLDRLKQIGKC